MKPKHRPYDITFDMEDKSSPVVKVIQQDEATIYLTLADALRLSKDLQTTLRRFKVSPKR